MTRTVICSFLLTGLAACQPTMDTDPRDRALEAATSCDEVLPAPVPWNGQPLPPPETDVNTIYLYDSPVGDGHLWAIAVDGDRIAATVDLAAQQLGGFVGMNLATGPQFAALASCGRIYKAVVKGTTSSPGHKGFTSPVAPPTPPLAAFLKSETAAVDAIWMQVVQDYVSGKICPLPPIK